MLKGTYIWLNPYLGWQEQYMVITTNTRTLTGMKSMVWLTIKSLNFIFYLDGNPCFYTGDSAFRDEVSSYHINGRIDDVITVGQYCYDPATLEDILVCREYVLLLICYLVNFHNRMRMKM